MHRAPYEPRVVNGKSHVSQAFDLDRLCTQRGARFADQKRHFAKLTDEQLELALSLEHAITIKTDK